MADVEEVEVVVAHRDCATLRVGDVFLKVDADQARTSWITDPDGYRIELVQWLSGHADGITEADFA
jgi:hypothetical protein